MCKLGDETDTLVDDQNTGQLEPPEYSALKARAVYENYGLPMCESAICLSFGVVYWWVRYASGEQGGELSGSGGGGSFRNRR